MSLLELADHTNRRRKGRPGVSPPTVMDRLCRSTEAAVAAAFAVSLDDLRSATRQSAGAAFARQTAMYLARVIFRQSYSAIGRQFARDRTTAAHACALVEQRRDDPAIDNLVQALETFCSNLMDEAQVEASR